MVYGARPRRSDFPAGRPRFDMTFHISTAGSITGPHDVASIRALLEAGAIHRHTPLRAEGSDEWLPLENWDAELLAPPRVAMGAPRQRHLQSVFMQSPYYMTKSKPGWKRAPIVVPALIALFAGGAWLLYHYVIR